MDISLQIKKIRAEKGLSQDEFAKTLHVTRQAVSKWESGRGYPDIENLISISKNYNIELNELILNDRKVEDKLIVASASKKWHLLVILFLVAIIGYIVYFVFAHKIYMIGFAIATTFMLIIELFIYFREKIFKRK